MARQHYMCTHTFVSQEAAEQFAEATRALTDRQIFEAMKTDKAEMLAHWRGEEEFFFCHWHAETEDDIFNALENVGFNQMIHTLPNAMRLYMSSTGLTDKTADELFTQ